MSLDINKKEFHELLQAQGKLAEVINSINRLENTEHIQQQLMAVKNQLKGINELKRTGIKLERLSIRSKEYDLIDLS